MPRAQVQARVEEVALHPWEEAANRFAAAKQPGYKRNRSRKRISTELQHSDLERFLKSDDRKAATKLLQATGESRVLVDNPRTATSSWFAIAINGQGLCEFNQDCGLVGLFGKTQPTVRILTDEKALERIRGVQENKGTSSTVSLKLLYMALDDIANRVP